MIFLPPCMFLIAVLATMCTVRLSSLSSAATSAWSVPVVLLVVLLSAAFVDAIPRPPVQEVHVMSLNVCSHARISAMSAQSVLASHDLTSSSLDSHHLSAGGPSSASTSYFFHGAMRYLNAHEIL